MIEKNKRKQKPSRIRRRHAFLVGLILLLGTINVYGAPILFQQMKLAFLPPNCDIDDPLYYIEHNYNRVQIANLSGDVIDLPLDEHNVPTGEWWSGDGNAVVYKTQSRTGELDIHIYQMNTGQLASFPDAYYYNQSRVSDRFFIEFTPYDVYPMYFRVLDTQEMTISQEFITHTSVIHFSPDNNYVLDKGVVPNEVIDIQTGERFILDNIPENSQFDGWLTGEQAVFNSAENAGNFVYHIPSREGEWVENIGFYVPQGVLYKGYTYPSVSGVFGYYSKGFDSIAIYKNESPWEQIGTPKGASSAQWIMLNNQDYLYFQRELDTSPINIHYLFNPETQELCKMDFKSDSIIFWQPQQPLAES